jgi:trimethylamine:corrinoid methyltransferase-like protein
MPSMVLDRLSADAWVKAGGKDSTTRAKERAKTILQEHQPEPLDGKTSQALEDEMKNILKNYSLKPTHLPEL